ncbi:MAG TPA: hypothetical protein VHP38_06965 [Ruminiclostridium sp.]|nr:hypothetical protein [Ruminiclostridium sp.]
MEEKVYNVFDSLDINEADRLLEKDMNFKLDSRTFKRIRKATYDKAGMRRKNRFIARGLPTVAAAMLLILLSVFFIGYDNVANAMGRLFGFIPGYGIVEGDGQNIQYIIDDRGLSSENSQGDLTITNGIAAGNNFTISCEVGNRGFVADQKKKDGGIGSVIPDKNSFTLTIDGREYKPSGYSIGAGGKTQHVFTEYEIKPEDLNTKTVYSLKYSEYNLSVNFKLKKPEGFDSLEEIGPTDTKNNISITAVSSHTDGKLQVELYPVNKSGYLITSYSKQYDYGYRQKDMVLETDKGSHSYTIPDSFMGPNNKFFFNVLPGEKNLVLKIPYLIVKSENEKNTVSLPIPESGQKTAVNKEVKFRDSTMKITDVERIKNDSPNGALRIHFIYENSNEDMVMCDAQFRRVNILGMEKGGGYSSKLEEGVMKSVDYNLEKNDGDTLRLKIIEPEYFLLGEYNIKLDVK